MYEMFEFLHGAPYAICVELKYFLLKNWVAGPLERRDRWVQFAQSPPPDCGAPTTCRLYPFDAPTQIANAFNKS